MMISKLLPLLCAAFLCAAISARADDNAAQAAARAALMQKMNELDTQQAEPTQPPAAEMQPTNPPPMASPEPTTPPPQPAITPNAGLPEQPPTPPTSEPPMTPPPAETQPTVPPPNPPPPQMSEQQQAMAEEQALLASKQTNAPATTSAPMVSNAKTTAPQQLVNMEPAAPGAPIAPTAAPVPSNAKKLKVKSARPTADFGFAPIQAPAPPVSSDQQAQLQALLEKYKADQITPDEYQAQRAAIIGPR